MTGGTPDRATPPGPGPLRPFHFPPVQRRTLANGLRLLVAENHAFPVATLDVMMPSGALAEPEARAGTAALVGGLLESGTATRDAAEIAETIDALGLSFESGSSWDTTLAGMTALTSRLEEGVEILADMVLRPAFPEREVERIRDERLAMLTQRRGDPASVADELMTRYTFPDGHPFGRRLAGPAGTLSTLARADVQAFHASFFVPQGAWLCAAGDVTMDQVVALAERWFGEWTGAPPAARVPEVPNRFDRTTIVLAHRPGSVQAELRVGHVGMERTADDFFAATVMNSILGGVFASRLNMNLRERLGYTYGISSSFGLRRLPGTFSIGSAVQSDRTAHAVSEILRDMRRLQDELAPAAEVADAAGYLAGIFPLQLQTTDGLAGKLSTLAVYGFPDDYYDHYRDALLAVTPEDVRTAARRRLMPDRAAVVVVGDASELRGPLEALDIGPVEVVDADAVLG